MSTSAYFSDPEGTEDDDLTLKQQIARFTSPLSAQSLVPLPPSSPPVSATGQSTPQTGSLSYAPTQSRPKVSGPPMLPGIATQPENLGARNVPQPVTTGARSGSPRTVIRDLNGTAAGSPLSTMPAARSGVAGAIVAQLGGGSAAPLQTASGYNVSPVRPAQSPYSSVMPVGAGGSGAMPVRGAAPLNLGPSTLAPQLNAQTQAYGNLMRMRAQNPGPTTLDSMPSRINGSSPMPVLPATASDIAPPGQQKLAQDQARLQYLQRSGSGIDQIKNPVGRGFARAGDIALRAVAPDIEPFVGGTEGHHQLLLDRQTGVVGGDQAQLQAAAQLADTRSQMNERDAMGRRYDAQANLYNPEPLSAGQAQTLGHPEWEGLKLDARDAERLVGGAAHNQTTLQTHFGGQQRTLSADDAAAIRTPSLEGANMSNDEYQRLLQGSQRNQQWDTNNRRTTQQSDVNNQRNNSTRITTTGMRDDTSAANSDRAHPGGGAQKPIPAGVRDRIESQKNTAIGKARASFDNGESSMDDYLDNWQQAQNDYEDRIQAQTGQPIQHLDVRSNVDSKGNWIGNRSQPQPAGTQPQTQTGKPGSFVTRGGSHVAVGDPVKVGRRSGTVTGFNAQTGKAQVKWESGN
jgi:hypothetical protein